MTTAQQTERLIPVELCHRNGEQPCTVNSYETLTAREAKQRLATKMTNAFFYRVQPPDSTGAIDGDEARYADDLDAIRAAE